VTHQLYQRLAKLEARHRPDAARVAKADRDAAVAGALANPEWFHQIGVRLLGEEHDGDRERHAAILAAWRADT
jgi:hypothetical protein